jgi:hypothetical protein
LRLLVRSLVAGRAIVTRRPLITRRPLATRRPFAFRSIRSRLITFELRALLIARQLEAGLRVAMFAAGPPFLRSLFTSGRFGKLRRADCGLR